MEVGESHTKRLNLSRVHLETVSDDALIDMKELCRQTALSKHWFYEMISEKRLPFGIYRFGRAVRFKRAEVRAWIEARRAKN